MAPRSALPPVAEAPEGEAPTPPTLRRRLPAPRAPPAPPPARAPPRLSDLDIQIAHRAAARPSEPPRPPRAARYGRVIPDTVESWARRAVVVRDGAFKPLVFGGTYPIEVPEGRPARPPVAEVRATVARAADRRELRRTVERSLDRFDAILARRGAPTFAVDAPVPARGPASADCFFGCPLALRDAFHCDGI